jgi:Uma2 family endonuclease
MDAARRIEVVYEVPSEHDRWLLDEDDMPESALHDAIIRLLVEILVAWSRKHAGRAAIGRNIALRWNEQNPKQGVDPDVYVVDPAPPEGEDATSICLWKPGHHPPRVAVEVVSETTAEKDYGDGPDRYAASGTRELWIFDPLRAGPDLRGGPHLLQLWRRDAAGNFRRHYAGDGPARSEELDAWLVVTDSGRRLRVAEHSTGAGLWPTAAESAEAAEAEVTRLRAEIARLKGSST